MAGIGTGWLIAGLVAPLVGSAFSFNRASKQRKEARSATNLAQQAMDKARKRTEMNKFGKLAINKDIYKDQRDSVTAASAQVTQAAAEGDPRGVGATAGRISAQSQAMQQQITIAQNQEAQKIELIKAQEDARLADEAMRIDMGEANQLFGTANTLNTMAAESTKQGVKGLTDAAQLGIKIGMRGVGSGAGRNQAGRLGRYAMREGSFANEQEGLRDAILKATAGGTGYERFNSLLGNEKFMEFRESLEKGGLDLGGDWGSDWIEGQALNFFSPDDFKFIRENYKGL